MRDHDHDRCLAQAMAETPQCGDLHEHPDGGVSRRWLLTAAGLAGGGLALGALPPRPAAAEAAQADPSSWRPNHDDVRFTLVVMPDTQYLFDADRVHPAPLDASLRWILDHAEAENIVFLAHLGDLTQNGLPSDFAAIGQSFGMLDRSGADYSVLAGNHDINSSTNDQRGDSPYLQTFGPARFASSGTFGGASPDGYNTYHVFRAAGRQWLVLALDWRPSAKGIAWAQSVIDQHPRLPVILTTHEIAFADDDGEAHLSDFGRQLWDGLIARNDQIFLTLNGHFWPPGRTVLSNAAGHDVHVHITNYQDRYYGGSAMIRTYRFDLARQTIDVRTFSPYFLAVPDEQRNELQRLEVELTDAANMFNLPIDFAKRFNGFDPAPVRAARPAKSVLVPGTLAYWRFDAGADGAPVPSDSTIGDQSGNGNDLTRVSLGGSTKTLTWSTEHHPDQPAHASLHFLGSKDPIRGAYLRTADRAPLNAMTFDRGYTIEAFVKLPPDFDDGSHAWCGLFSRMGSGRDAGKTGDDPSEPTGTLNLDGGGAAQWAVFPRNQNRIVTNWSHLLPLNTWWHIAVVNDGTHTVMYIDGCPVVGNPSTSASGIASTGEFWMLGAYDYDRIVEQSFYGWLGDVRVVGRPLSVGEFLIAE